MHLFFRDCDPNLFLINGKGERRQKGGAEAVFRSGAEAAAAETTSLFFPVSLATHLTKNRLSMQGGGREKREGKRKEEGGLKLTRDARDFPPPPLFPCSPRPHRRKEGERNVLCKMGAGANERQLSVRVRGYASRTVRKNTIDVIRIISASLSLALLGKRQQKTLSRLHLRRIRERTCKKKPFLLPTF